MSSLVPVGRVCAIIVQNGDYAVFMFNQDLHGDAKATLDTRVVDLDDPDLFGDGFAEIDPNFVILSPDCLSFCGRNSTLYVFQGICSLIDASPSLVGIYALELSCFDQSLLERKPERSKHPVLDLTKLKPVSSMVAPKLLPETVRCKQGIVVFSMMIQYTKEKVKEEDDYMDESYKQHLAETAPICADFELFLPDGQKTVRLPQLSILRHQRKVYLERQGSRELVLVLPSSTSIREASDSASSFYITSFSVINDGTILVVKTNFGASFFLNIGLQQQPEWNIFSGFVLPHLHRNFVTTNDELILCPGGACEFTSMFYYGDHFDFYNGFSSNFSNGDGSGSRCLVRRFPLSSSIQPHFLWRNFTMEVSEFAKLPQYDVCILQIGLGRLDRVHCTLDVLRLDPSKFFEVGDHQFARRIKSFKFLGDYIISNFCPEYCYLYV